MVSLKSNDDLKYLYLDQQFTQLLKDQWLICEIFLDNEINQFKT